jgi:hypothetical protein
LREKRAVSELEKNPERPINRIKKSSSNHKNNSIPLTGFGAF